MQESVNSKEDLIKDLKDAGFDYESNKKKIDRYFNYLESLRRSGVTNMYGASPYLASACKLEKRKADSILSIWMKYYSNLSDYFGWGRK